MEITSKPYLSLLFLYTKMRNVAGIAQSEAQKSSDMFAKCQYLGELTGGKGVTFATAFFGLSGKNVVFMRAESIFEVGFAPSLHPFFQT